MADHIELEIRNLLKSQYSAHEIASRMLSRLVESKLSAQDRRSIFAFVYNAGLYQDLARSLTHLFHERFPISWSCFIALHAEAKLRPSPEVIESSFKGAKRQNALEDLVLLKHWDVLDRRFSETRSQIQRERLEKEKRQRELFFDKLIFLKNHQLINEEERLLTLLEKIYPDDSVILSHRSEFEDRWARHVIAKHSRAEADPLEKTFTETDNKELDWAWFITREAEKLIDGRASAAYDWAIAMWFMEFFDCALFLLEKAPSSVAADWFKVDLLLKCRRFLDALDWLAKLEKNYGDDSEAPFHLTYWRALALWGIGQRTSAVELLSALVQIRPTYRSAAALLKQWRDGGDQ